MKTDDIIKQKLSMVLNYSKLMHGKKFGINHGGGKNKMACAVIFQIYFSSYKKFIKTCHDIFTNDEESEIIQRLDFLINIYNSSDEDWKHFWDGKQPINPSKVPFIDNKKGPKYIDLNQIKEITFSCDILNN